MIISCSLPNKITAKGFTLAELLVVICIIGLLAALLIPYAMKVQESSRSTKCMSNLKQLGVGALAFAAENDGALPSNSPAIWYSSVWKYVYPDKTMPTLPSTPGIAVEGWKGTVFECPEMIRHDPRDMPYRSYGFNLRAGDSFTSTPDKSHSLQANLSSIAMIGEGMGSNLLGITSIWSRHKYTDATDRYSGFCNVVFMDGHVEAVQLTKRITGEDGSNNYFDRFWGVTKYQDRW